LICAVFLLYLGFLDFERGARKIFFWAKRMALKKKHCMLVAQIFKDNLWGKKRQMKTKRPKVRANAGKESSIDKLAGKKKR
jgi:hypothetical protein